MIRVLLADDHAIVRMGLRAVLDSDDEIVIVAEVETANDAVRAVEESMTAEDGGIDVVLMDLRFGPGQTGREREGGASATARIRAFPTPPNGAAILRRSGINYPAVTKTTKRTPHMSHPFRLLIYYTIKGPYFNM